MKDSNANAGTAASLPLSGVRVIDFTHHAAGPMCTMLLGDYGAEVIKVEPPGGEAFRTSGTVRVAGEHVGFLALNRNKKSVVLDLKTPEGKELLIPFAKAFLKEVDLPNKRIRVELPAGLTEL